MRILVAPLPATERAGARRVLQQTALPDLAAWITAAQRAPETWTATRHSRSWRPQDGATAYRDDQQPYP